MVWCGGGLGLIVIIIIIYMYTFAAKLALSSLGRKTGRLLGSLLSTLALVVLQLDWIGVGVQLTICVRRE